MKVLSIEEIRSCDEEANKLDHFPSMVLMEHAGYALYNKIINLYPQGRFYIVCGPGNNSGDGFVLGRLLLDHHYSLRIYCHDLAKLTGDALKAKQMLERYNVEISDEFKVNDEIIVDCLFGSGLNRMIDGKYLTLINEINKLNNEVVSVDIPSGLNGNSGMALPCCIKANHTLTLAAYKYGLLLNEGRNCCGKIHCLDIMLPNHVLANKGMTLIDETIASLDLVANDNHSHKGSNGKVLLVGGNKSMSGALIMSASACLRGGVGLTTCFVPSCIFDIVASSHVEMMCIKASSDDYGFNEQAIDELRLIMNDYDYICIGNGLGRTKVNAQLLKLLLESNNNLVIDGDALYLLQEFTYLLKRKAKTILLPHLKEFSYFSGYNLDDIKANPFALAQKWYQNYPNTCLVLKDSITTIMVNNQGYILNKPTRALAKGGSGDVLSGLITSLVALQGDYQGVIAGCYLHNACAHYVSQNYSAQSIVASDIIDSIKVVLKQLRKE